MLSTACCNPTKFLGIGRPGRLVSVGQARAPRPPRARLEKVGCIFGRRRSISAVPDWRYALQPNARERWQCRRERAPKPYKHDSSGVAPASPRSPTASPSALGSLQQNLPFWMASPPGSGSAVIISRLIGREPVVENYLANLPANTDLRILAATTRRVCCGLRIGLCGDPVCLAVPGDPSIVGAGDILSDR